MSSSSLRRAAICAATAALTLSAASLAHGDHWPSFGGGDGRSGFQPVDAGGVPVGFRYRNTAVAEQLIKTSIVTTTGPPTTAADGARFAFGTNDGRVQVRRLADGAAIGPAAGTDIGDDDAFGTRSVVPGANGSSVSFADTSGPGGLGQLFVAHNDDSEIGDASPSDIEVAQFDEATGDLVQQVDIAGTNGYTIESSLLATQPAVDDPATVIDETRTRLLFFVASDGLGTQALFRVIVTGDPAGRGAVVNGGRGDQHRRHRRHPVRQPGDRLPAQRAGRSDRLRRGRRGRRPEDVLSVEPRGRPAAALGGPAQTPVVPVQPTGLTPSPALGNSVTSAPFVYVASDTGNTTTVYQLSGTTSALNVLRASEALPGPPAPGLSTNQVSEPSVAHGKLVVTTGANLYLLTTQDLDRAGQLVAADNLVAGSTGFRQTVASASGDHAYATNDQGQHFVLRLSDGKAVSGGEFSADGSATPLANGGVGQPSIARGFILYGGGRGAFAYRNSDRTDPVVDPLRAPTPDSTVDGMVSFSTLAWDARGIASVTFRSNGQPFGTDGVADSGSPFGSPGAAYSVAIETGSLARGVYLIDAVATDTAGRTATSEQRRITIRGATDDRPPSIDFTKLKEQRDARQLHGHRDDRER